MSKRICSPYKGIHTSPSILPTQSQRSSSSSSPSPSSSASSTTLLPAHIESKRARFLSPCKINGLVARHDISEFLTSAKHESKPTCDSYSCCMTTTYSQPLLLINDSNGYQGTTSNNVPDIVAHHNVSLVSVQDIASVTQSISTMSVVPLNTLDTITSPGSSSISAASSSTDVHSSLFTCLIMNIDDIMTIMLSFLDTFDLTQNVAVVCHSLSDLIRNEHMIFATDECGIGFYDFEEPDHLVFTKRGIPSTPFRLTPSRRTHLLPCITSLHVKNHTSLHALCHFALLTGLVYVNIHIQGLSDVLLIQAIATSRYHSGINKIRISGDSSKLILSSLIIICKSINLTSRLQSLEVGCDSSRLHLNRIIDELDFPIDLVNNPIASFMEPFPNIPNTLTHLRLDWHGHTIDDFVCPTMKLSSPSLRSIHVHADSGTLHHLCQPEYATELVNLESLALYQVGDSSRDAAYLLNCVCLHRNLRSVAIIMTNYPRLKLVNPWTHDDKPLHLETLCFAVVKPIISTHHTPKNGFFDLLKSCIVKPCAWSGDNNRLTWRGSPSIGPDQIVINNIHMDKIDSNVDIWSNLETFM